MRRNAHLPSIHSRSVLGLVVALTMSCGPVEDPNGCCYTDGDAGPTQPDAADPFNGVTATVTGTVWAPGQAIGMVPAGQEIPIYNALITVSPLKQAPIPQNTYCERCVNPSGTYVFSDHQGNFSLSGVLPNDYWMTIQKGQFRLERQIALSEGQILELPTDMSTLPSVHDPSNGNWIPKIAMGVGSYDHLEDILGKMGLGTVDSSGRYVASSADGIMDVYTNGTSFGGEISGDLSQLVGDLNLLLQYHILFIPCSNSSETDALRIPQNLRNIQEFVAQGGKLYVTDWSGEWHDNVFPEQVTLGGGVDTPASAYDAATNTWDTDQFGSADGSAYDSENAEIVDPDLHQWLGTQSGPIVEN